MHARRIVVSIVLSMGCGSEVEPPTPPPCEQVLDHVSELRSRRVGAVAGAPHAVARRKRALARALGDDYLAACEAAPESTVSCLLAANDATQLDACPQPTLAQEDFR
ncbi:MAG TPA: hypothetical protein VG755_01185 [Nannocystaceae bacterium]|nr:hypothetical protein [Nannocystaceae bacterium]